MPLRHGVDATGDVVVVVQRRSEQRVTVARSDVIVDAADVIVADAAKQFVALLSGMLVARDWPLLARFELFPSC